LLFAASEEQQIKQILRRKADARAKKSNRDSSSTVVI
jgi:hypothetical protein